MQYRNRGKTYSPTKYFEDDLYYNKMRRSAKERTKYSSKAVMPMSDEWSVPPTFTMQI